MVRSLAVAALFLTPALVTETGADRLQKIRDVRFTPDGCWRVRDVFLEREDLKIHFSDGYLLFAQPVEGRTLAAAFLAATETGEGEVILIPPSRSERQSLARFLGTPVLQEHIRTALMFFTDDTAEVLRKTLAENEFNRVDREAGQKLAEDWRPVARNMIAAYEARMLMDSFSPLGVRAGFFAAAVSGVKLGRFDLMVDARRGEQVTLGQVAWHEGQRYYDVWASFPGRDYREGKKRPAGDSTRLEDYRLEAAIGPQLDLKVSGKATLVAGEARERALVFELSRQMRVTSLLLDGRPVEYIQNEALDSSGVKRRGNDQLLVVLDAALDPGSRHELEFQCEGNVITDAGHGVYYVGARGNWYLSRGAAFTNYELVFRHPRRLELVATGKLVESSVDGEVRVTRWKPDGRIRVAGFNLGNFERTETRVGDYTVEVLANRELEPSLRPPPMTPVIEPIPPPSRRPLIPRPPSAILPPVPQEMPAPPARRIEQVARESGEALEFFLSKFGPPVLRRLAISPIPGRFGQGFPGLVYISTLSYYQPGDRLLSKMSPQTALFYSEHLRAHEIAHQWWGSLVGVATYHDEWLVESLADYSALLFLESQKGARVLEGVLARYRDNLLAKQDDGQTVESAGAIVLGDRLRTSRSPLARHTITYEKGAWVLHMLRRLMGDQKFYALLSELRRQYQYRTVSTEQFRQLAARFLPPLPSDPNLENFFHQWVYSTGIPALKMEYKIAGKPPRVRVTGVVRQSGVSEDFSIPVPVEIQPPGRGERTELRVQTGNDEATFSLTLAQRPVKVLLDPRDSVLAVK
jgi:hypothetical protein